MSTAPAAIPAPAAAPRPGHLPFNQLGVSDAILKAVAQLGYEEASPIQSAAIPVILSGVDIVGQSQTGSGKTAAFCIPAIERVDVSSKAVQVLVLTPTRELATQVADEAHKLSAFKKGLHSVPIYGGASYERQFMELRRGAQFVVGTPGRLMDHMERGTIDLSQVKMVILDEADRMLDMGFRDDIETILSKAPKERQTVFFSATLSPQIQALIRKNSKSPQTVKIEQKAVTGPPLVEQAYYEVRHHAKFEALVRLLDYYEVASGVIFCNTQRTVDELADALLGRGYSADRLHGGIPQGQRTRVMNNFKDGVFSFLVATDVAARGIDVDNLELVVNFDLPYDAEDYVHRIGRTGRAGKKGRAATFVSGAEIYKLQTIERYTKAKIHRETVPTLEAVEGKRADALFEKVRGVLDAGAFTPHTAFLDRLLEQGHSATDVSSVLLGMLIGAEPVKGEARGAEKSGAKSAAKDGARVRPPGSSADDVSYATGPGLSGKSALETARAYAAAQAAEGKPVKPASKVSKTGSWTVDKPAMKTTEIEVSKPKPKAPRLPEVEAPSPNEADALPKPAPGKQWMALNLKSSDGLKPAAIVEILVGGTDIPHKAVGTIKLEAEQSYIEIERALMPKMLARLSSLEVGGRKLVGRSMFAAVKTKKSGKW